MTYLSEFELAQAQLDYRKAPINNLPNNIAESTFPKFKFYITSFPYAIFDLQQANNDVVFISACQAISNLHVNRQL